MNAFLRTAAVTWIATLVTACSALPEAGRPGDTERARLYGEYFDRLSVFDSWIVSGRLAVSGEEDGGSGNFKWRKGGLESRIDFHGALGRGAWQLESDSAGARLELADGSVYRAGSVDQLVRGQLGWEIPVDSLSWWVRGLAAPGAVEKQLLDEQGNLKELLQDGWTIEFGKYRVHEGLRLPSRLTARQDKWKVKLALRGWELGLETSDGG